jgi:hypothetical protein
LSTKELNDFSPVTHEFEKTNSKMDDYARRLWAAMHWLRRARESADQSDKLLDLWIALEFLVADTKVEEVCSSAQMSGLLQALKTKASEMGIPNAELILTSLKFAMTNPSLKSKFDALVKSRSIPLDEREEKIVWGPLRENRNNLEHGRIFDVQPEDLEVMEQMISKVVWILANQS